MALDPNDCTLCRHGERFHHLVTDDLFRCNICKEVHPYTPYVRSDIEFEEVLKKMEKLIWIR